MEKKSHRLKVPVRFDPVTDEYVLSLPESFCNELDWYEGTEVIMTLDVDINMRSNVYHGSSNGDQRVDELLTRGIKSGIKSQCRPLAMNIHDEWQYTSEDTMVL